MGTWYKFVGYILPEGTAALGNAEKRGGIYNTETGAKLADSTALIWNEDRLNDNVNFTLGVSGFTQTDGSEQARIWKPEIREVEQGAILKNDDLLDIAVDAELNGPPPPPVSYESTGRGDNALAGLELNLEPGHVLEDGTLPAGWSGWNRDESVWETVDGPYTEAGANNVSALALTNTEAPASGTDHNANANLAQSIDTLDGSKAYEYTFYFQRNTDSDFRFLAGPGNAPRDPVTNELVATFKNATNGAANFYPKL